MIGESRSVLFVSCFKVRCFVIVLFRAIIDYRLVNFAFSFLSLARIKQCLLLPSTKSLLTFSISFAVLEQSRVILSQAGRARYIVICINPTFTKMIDGTEKPKYLLSLQNAQRDTTNFAVIVTVSVVLQQVLAAETYYLQFI